MLVGVALSTGPVVGGFMTEYAGYARWCSFFFFFFFFLWLLYAISMTTVEWWKCSSLPESLFCRWRSLFYLNIPFAIIGILICWTLVPDTPQRVSPIDWVRDSLAAHATGTGCMSTHDSHIALVRAVELACCCVMVAGWFNCDPSPFGRPHLRCESDRCH